MVFKKNLCISLWYLKIPVHKLMVFKIPVYKFMVFKNTCVQVYGI